MDGLLVGAPVENGFIVKLPKVVLWLVVVVDSPVVVVVASEKVGLNIVSVLSGSGSYVLVPTSSQMSIVVSCSCSPEGSP